MTNSKKAKRFQFWINVVLILITLSIILPFVLVFISSLTDENTLIRNGYSFFPEKFSFYAYSYIIRQGEKILRAYGITVFVTIVGTAANLAMSALLAYPLSIKKLPYRRAITFFVFFTMLFNGGLVPTYLMYVKYFHIKNTIWALIVPGFLLSANNVLMIRSYFNTSTRTRCSRRPKRWRRTHEDFHQHHTAAWKTDSGNHGTVFRTWLLE